MPWPCRCAVAAAWLSLETLEQLKSALVTANPAYVFERIARSLALHRSDRAACLGRWRCRSAVSCEVPKADGQTVRVPADVQTAAVAHLFDGDDDGRSLPRLILEALLAVRLRARGRPPCCDPIAHALHRLQLIATQCPMDVRLPAAEHVLLTGGTTTMPGFSARLVASVRALAAAEARYQALRPAAARLAVINSPFARGACAWTGGTRGRSGGLGGGNAAACGLGLVLPRVQRLKLRAGPCGSGWRPCGRWRR